MSEIDEKQMVLYAQMANLVSFILQRPDINIKEIAENFSKVCIKKQFLGSFFFPDERNCDLLLVLQNLKHSLSKASILQW